MMNNNQWSSPHTFLLVEIGITLTIGVVFAFNDWKFSVLVAAIGAMIACAMHAIPRRVCDDVRTEIEDVSKTTQILDLCRRIELVDLQSAKRAILDDSIQSLTELSECKIFNERFYAWVFQRVDETKTSIKAVSAMIETEWILPREMLYYEKNKKAIDRGIEVTRIFLTTHDRLLKKENRYPILLHMLHGLDARIIFPPKARTLQGHELIVNGMTIFDDHILYQDVILPPGDSTASAGGKILHTETDVQRTILNYNALLRLTECPLRVLSHTDNVDVPGEIEEILNRYYGSYQSLQDTVSNSDGGCKSDKFALTYWEKIKQGTKLI